MESSRYSLCAYWSDKKFPYKNFMFQYRSNVCMNWLKFPRLCHVSRTQSTKGREFSQLGSLTSTFGGNSDTWFRHFWPNVRNFPKIFQSRLKPLLYRLLEKSVAIPKLRQSVAIATFGGRRRNCDTMPQSVAIATTASKHRKCNIMSKCRNCDVWRHLSQ